MDYRNILHNGALLHCSAAIIITLIVSWLQIRPLGILFLIVLAIWIYKSRCTAAVKVIPPPEISGKVSNVYNKLIKLRQERPAMFCGIASGVLATLAIIGHLISGSTVVILGLIAAALLSTKYNFQVIQVPSKETYIWKEPTDHDVDEFLPEVNESNLFVLQRASEQAISNTSSRDDEDKNDEVPPELLIPDSIPEIDEHSDASSDDDLILGTSTSIPQKTDTIEFKSGYFNKDSPISTSSSEDSLSRGLNFPEYSTVDSKDPRIKSAPPPQSSQILPNLVSGLVSWSVGNQLVDKLTSSVGGQPMQSIQNDSSDDSEFEILNTDDLNNP